MSFKDINSGKKIINISSEIDDINRKINKLANNIDYGYKCQETSIVSNSLGSVQKELYMISREIKKVGQIIVNVAIESENIK